jgi:ABC-type phosphate transport system permease subunit
MAVDDAVLLLDQEQGLSQDQRAELWLGALVCGVILLLLAMVVFIVAQAWPSFAHNGLHWFGSGGDIDQQIQAIFTSGNDLHRPVYTFHAWPLIWSTILTTVGAAVLAFICALFISIFMVEFAPVPVQRVLEPVVRLLASVPSVIYGLVGVLMVVPFIGKHLITAGERASVTPIIPLDGSSLLAAVVLLTVMISPIMISIFADGLRAVPQNWLEGSLGLGVNRWRTFWNVAVRSARPALIAGVVLATARALGESVMLSMVSGSIGFAPNPVDGLIFFLEPSRGLAPTILHNTDELSSPPMEHTLFAIAAVLMFSALMLSLIGWVARVPMNRYFLQGGAELGSVARWRPSEPQGEKA